MVHLTSPAFKDNAARAMADPGLQKALARSKASFPGKRTAAVAAYQEPSGWPSLRMAGRQTFSRRNSRSQGLMVCMKVSYSARFTVA